MRAPAPKEHFDASRQVRGIADITVDDVVERGALIPGAATIGVRAVIEQPLNGDGIEILTRAMCRTKEWPIPALMDV